MVRTLIGLTAAALLVPLAANAQTNVTQTTTTYESPEQMNPATKPTTNLLIGAGVANYDRALAAVTEPGAGYQGTVVLNPVRNLGIELGYLGAVNDVRTRYSSNGQLIANQVGANVRLNLVPPAFELPGDLTPFVFGGAGYQSVDTQNFVPGVTSANAFAVPVGGGIEAALGGHFMIGARYTYNFLFAANANFPGGKEVDDWLASINLGARFGG